MQNHSIHKSESGFTLIELLIVIAIIGILTSVAIPQYSQYKIRGYDAQTKQALKNMHLLCNAYWLDTSVLQGCDLSKIKEPTYGFNQNADVVATLPPSPLDNFCPSAKHNDSPNTFSIDSAALISETGDCGKERAEAQVAEDKKEEFKNKYESCGNDWEEYKKYGKHYTRNDNETFIPIEFFQAVGSQFGYPNERMFAIPDTPILGYCAQQLAGHRLINNSFATNFGFRIPGCKEEREVPELADPCPRGGSPCNVWVRKTVPCGRTFNNVSSQTSGSHSKRIQRAQILNDQYLEELRENGKESADRFKENQFRSECKNQAREIERRIIRQRGHCQRNQRPTTFAPQLEINREVCDRQVQALIDDPNRPRLQEFCRNRAEVNLSFAKSSGRQ